MSAPFKTQIVSVFSDGSIVVAVVPPPPVDPLPPVIEPTPGTFPAGPVAGIPLAPGFNWSSLKADTAYVLADGNYVGPGKQPLPSGVTLSALHKDKAVIQGKKGQPNLWGTDGNKDYSVNLTLVDLVFEGGGWGKYNHESAVRTNDGWKLIRVTIRRSGGTGINIEGEKLYSEFLLVEDNAASGRGGKVRDYVEVNATTRRNNLVAKDSDGSSKFTKSSGVTIIGLKSYENFGAGIWFDGNRGNMTIRDSQFFNNYADVDSRARGIFIEYALGGTTVIENNYFYGNEGADIEVAESARVTIQDNDFLPGKPGSEFRWVAISLRDIARDYEDGRKKVQDALQLLVVEGNRFHGTRIERNESSQDIRISKNTLSFGVNDWRDQDGQPSAARIDVPQ